MTISTLDEAPSRAARREETARLLHEASTAKGTKRDDLIDQVIDQNRDFLTYAVPTISGEIKRHFRDQGWTIRPPRRVQEIQSKVIHAYHRGEEHGAPPSAERIAEQLDLPVPDVS